MCHLVTALGLRPAARAGRILLALGGGILGVLLAFGATKVLLFAAPAGFAHRALHAAGDAVGV